MVNVYWKGGSGLTKSDISTQANWCDSEGTQITNTVWNSGDLSAHNIILDRTKNISPSDPVGIILDGSPSTVTFNSLYIKYSDNSKWHNMLQFGNSQTTLVLSGLDVRKSEMISATANTIIKFTGIPHHNSSAVSGNTTGTVGGGNDAADLYIKIVDEDTNLNSFFNRSLDYSGSALTLGSQYRTAGMFTNTSSRDYITFLFEPPNNTLLVLDDGIYPKMDFDCAGTNTAILCFDVVFTNQGSKSNSFGMVDMLNLNIDSSFKVKPRQHLLQNKQKHIKLTGGYTLNCTVFDMGYSTLEIIPTVNNPSSSGHIPSSDTDLFGITPSATQRRGMKVKYTKLIIGSPVNDSYKLLIADNNIITCEELVIKAGGRLYGTNYGDDNTAEIHCLKQPVIEGDWNFTEISKGIYRAAGTTPTLPVTMGGTGLNEIGLQSQVLAVKSNGKGLEWRADIDTNTTYSAYGGSAAGLVPTRDTGNTTTKYLREDGDWIVPPSGGGSGTVTSVGLTETGSALTITGSPVTTSGTINIAGAGSSSQVILGNLSLGTLTSGTVTGTGSANQVSYWTGTSVQAGSTGLTYDPLTGNLTVGGYVEVGTKITTPTGTDLTLDTVGGTDSGSIVISDGVDGQVSISANGSGAIKLGAATNPVTVSNVYTLPTAVTTDNGYVLTAQTDGSTAWAASGGGGSGTVTPSSTDTFTNKTLDANATGNAISNIDIENMTPAVIQLSSENFSNDDVTLMTSAAIEDKITAQITTRLAALRLDLSPIAFEARSLGTSTGVKIPAVTSSSGGGAFAYPMPLAGKVKYVSFLFSGGAITGNALNVVRVVKNNTSSSSNYVDVDFNAEVLVNKGGTGEYIYTHVSSLGASALVFAAGDVIWIQRLSGNTNLQHAYVVLWVGI